MSETHDFGPSPQELARFDNDLPAWLAGHLSESDEAWMEEMQARHQELALQVLWLRDARLAMREEAAAQDTTAAWELLQARIHAPERVKPEQNSVPKMARWLQWLLGNPGCANALAGLAVVMIVGQAVWIAAGVTPDVSQPPQEEPAWRSLDFDDLQTAGHGVSFQLHLKEQSLEAELNRLAFSLDARAVSAWKPQVDGSWVLQMKGADMDAQRLLNQLKQSPLIEKVQLLP